MHQDNIALKCQFSFPDPFKTQILAPETMRLLIVILLLIPSRCTANVKNYAVLANILKEKKKRKKKHISLHFAFVDKKGVK